MKRSFFQERRVIHELWKDKNKSYTQTDLSRKLSVSGEGKIRSVTRGSGEVEEKVTSSTIRGCVLGNKGQLLMKCSGRTERVTMFCRNHTVIHQQIINAGLRTQYRWSAVITLMYVLQETILKHTRISPNSLCLSTLNRRCAQLILSKHVCGVLWCMYFTLCVCVSLEYKLLKERHFAFFLQTWYSGFLK